MIQMVGEGAGECGLCINKGKSNVLLYNCRESKPDEVGGMKVVSSIRYPYWNSAVTDRGII